VTKAADGSSEVHPAGVVGRSAGSGSTYGVLSDGDSRTLGDHQVNGVVRRNANTRVFLGSDQTVQHDTPTQVKYADAETGPEEQIDDRHLVLPRAAYRQRAARPSPPTREE
jgi:hypothetical protein